MPSGIIQGTFGFIYTLASPAVDGSEAIKKKNTNTQTDFLLT